MRNSGLSDLYRLSEQILLFPVIHGSIESARALRGAMLDSPSDCLALCLPPEFQPSVEDGISRLPHITISCQRETSGEVNYVPVDPCQPVITALRIAMQENIPRLFIDRSTAQFHQRKMTLPDAYALNVLPYEKFCLAFLPTLAKPDEGGFDDLRVKWMAHQLHAAELDRKRIFCVCSIHDWPWIRDAYNETTPFTPPDPIESIPELFSVDRRTLLFALGEFPYITYLHEKRRLELKSDGNLSIDGVKEILLKAREIYLTRHNLKHHNLTPQTFQIHLQYLRNLSLMDNRLTPDLYTLVSTSKQIGGDPFALAVLEASRFYPYQDADTQMDSLQLGIDSAVFDDDQPARMKNRLSESHYVWKNIQLKSDPDPEKQIQWKYKWNPLQQCSWPPEDDIIESFHAHIRDQARIMLCNDLARSEKFTSSVKDGLDIRETLRHWHTGDLYVKDIPPSRGEVEIVVFLFDDEPDANQYPWRQTWYAEHEEESTLCFFATDYRENLVGPGIARAHYGGCMMIFPPRPIPDIWSDPRLDSTGSPDAILLEAALLHSRHKHITLVSPTPPRPDWRKLARDLNKRIIHVPINRFSPQTLQKIRRFHVLNGKEVRSFAGRFIQEL